MALMLKYRNSASHEGSWQDLLRALSLARVHAAEGRLDSARIGVIVFSANGKLAAPA